MSQLGCLGITSKFSHLLLQLVLSIHVHETHKYIQYPKAHEGTIWRLAPPESQMDIVVFSAVTGR